MRGRGRLIGVGGALALVSACGEDELEVAQVAEHCGVAGPVRVLEHAEDQVAYRASRRVGERLLFEVGRVGEAPGEKPLVPIVDAQVWTAGTCGESPERLDERYRDLFVIDRWPGVVLACDEANSQIVSLGASGPLAPHPVFPGATCVPRWTAHGMVIPDWTDSILFFPYPDDPRSGTAAPIKLPGGVKVVGSEPVFAAAEAGVFVLRPDDELVYFDLGEAGEPVATRVQAGVGDFVVSPSGRYVVWGGVHPGGDEMSGGVQAVVLNDRATGSSVGLGEASLSRADVWVLAWAEEGFVLLDSLASPQIFRLSDFASARVPGGYSLASRMTVYADLGPLADGRWIVSSERDSTLHYFDVGTGAVAPMFTKAGQVLGRTGDATLVLAVSECCEYGRSDDEGAVWLIPDDGSEARRIAGRSTMFGWLAGERSWLSPVDLDPARGARLVRVDTNTLAETVIDERVYSVFGMGRGDDPDIVRYSVQDGARSGVWQVRLAE